MITRTLRDIERRAPAVDNSGTRTMRERYDWIEALGAAIAARARSARHIHRGDRVCQMTALKSLRAALDDVDVELKRLSVDVWTPLI